MAKNLLRKGNAWYFTISIPRPLRHRFLGKAAVWEALGPNKDPAEIKCADLVAQWTRGFARMRSDEKLTPEQIKAEIVDTALVRKGAYLDMLAESATMIPGWPGPLEPEEKAKAQGIADAIRHLVGLGRIAGVTTTTAEPTRGETISQAAAHMFEAMEKEGVSKNTIKDSELHVAKFIKAVRDIPLASVTRDKASDFLDEIDNGGTRNNYVNSLSRLFKSASKRGRFHGENPFEGLRAPKSKGKKRDPFTVEQLQKMFDSRPHDIAPVKHSGDSALPWIIRIGAFTGMRLEEICQLKASDVRTEGANGGSLLVFDVHDDGENSTKNDASNRKVPVHSALVRAGLLEYKKALPPDGLLFPGLTRRASKGGKLYALTSGKFRDLLRDLDIKTPRLCFHSFRHLVEQTLRSQGVPQDDIDDITGHAPKSIGRKVYSTAELSIMKATVERIHYDGLRV
jgi:integrase